MLKIPTIRAVVFFATIFVCLAVTFLNNYVGTLNYQDWLSSTKWNNIQTARNNQVGNALQLVGASNDNYSDLMQITTNFMQERNNIAFAYHRLYDGYVGLAQTAHEEELYIELLTKALIAFQIKVPEANPATIPVSDFDAPKTLDAIIHAPH